MAILAGYRFAMRLAGPLVPRWLDYRTRRGKEQPDRLAERTGRSAVPRPDARLIWAHAASVGESAALRALIDRLLARHPDLSVLITTGTLTSARMVARWPGDRLIHQYVPLDHPRFVADFLDHWRPDAAVWVESELWPNLLRGLAERRIPAALVSARMSPASFRNWSLVPATARRLLASFDSILPASEEAARMLRRFVPDRVGAVGNLKLANPPPAIDESALTALRQAIGQRRVWIAASTHDGEEQAVLAAHRRLITQFGDLLTLIVPRHPDRSGVIGSLIEAAGHPVVRRSQGALPDAQTTVYLADTMGELGTLYAVAEAAFVGGSLVPIGGHNPIEPVMLGKPVILGPHSFAFRDEVAFLLSEGGARRIDGAEGLAPGVAELLSDPIGQRRLERIGHRVRDTGAAILDAAVATVESLLPGPASGLPQPMERERD